MLTIAQCTSTFIIPAKFLLSLIRATSILDLGIASLSVGVGLQMLHSVCVLSDLLPRYGANQRPHGDMVMENVPYLSDAWAVAPCADGLDLKDPV